MGSTRSKTPKKYIRCLGLLGYKHILFLVLIKAFVFSSVKATQNLALGKPAYLSDTGYSAPPSRAVDGNSNGNFGTCACSSSFANAWWKVDLGDVYVIDHVIVYNRLDCCGERLQYVQLFIGLYDGDYTQHGYHPGIVGISHTFNLPPDVYGRWIMITRVPGMENHVLTLCEVQVMGNEIANSLKYRQGDGLIGTGIPLDSSQASSKVACCVQCKATDKCVAVNYNSDTEVCEKLETVATTDDSNESHYFYRWN